VKCRSPLDTKLHVASRAGYCRGVQNESLPGAEHRCRCQGTKQEAPSPLAMAGFASLAAVRFGCLLKT
jgi:hypothetical protein